MSAKLYQYETYLRSKWDFSLNICAGLDGETQYQPSLKKANRRSIAFNESNARSLVLNATYEPIKIVHWQKAIILWLQDKVDVLEFHSYEIRSARERFKLPSVMKLKAYIRPRRGQQIKFSRENVYLRDDYTCQYCAKRFPSKELTLDHVIPASKMGPKTWNNVVTACRECNHRKSNRTPLAAKMPLLNQPRTPDWLPAKTFDLESDRIPAAWREYLLMAVGEIPASTG